MQSNILLDERRISMNEVKKKKYTRHDFIKPLSNFNYHKRVLLQSRKNVRRRRKMQRNREKFDILQMPLENEFGHKRNTKNDTRNTDLYKQSPNNRQDASNSSNPFSRTIILVSLH